ncbi:hypothetical protein C0995_015613, partial [Termitomyces sp. Mi166
PIHITNCKAASDVAAFAVGLAGNKGCWFVTIRGTDQQIGEALVVIGKHIAKRRVHAPRKQKTGNSAPNVAAPAPSPTDMTFLLYPVTLGCYPHYLGYSVVSSGRKPDGDWSSDVCQAFGLWLTNGYHIAHGPIYPDT